MRRSALPIAALLAVIPAAAAAHHGWSSYDSTHPITLTAPLTEVSWGNPHGQAKVEYENRIWDVVLAPIARMRARGLSEAMISSGQRVTLLGYPRRDGTAEMRIERLRVGDRTIELR